MEEDPNKAASLLIEHGLDGVRLREATVAELLAVAWVLGLWHSVEEIVRGNEERKRSLVAQRVSSAHAAAGSSPSDFEDRPASQCKRRCAQPESSAECHGPIPPLCIASTAAATAEAEVTAANTREAASPSTDVVDSHPTGVNESGGRNNLPTHAQECADATAGQGDAAVQPDSANVDAGQSMANDSGAIQTTSPGDPYIHLERIGQLVACANPAAPNAKAVAAEVVKELLALVQKRVLPDPPEEILTQLQSAAIRLGVHGAPSHAPQACGQPAEPAG
ncbi:hypothetical protein ACSSS7_000013 [Eimeria intestinalis]